MRQRLVEGIPLDVGARVGAPVLGIEHEYRVLNAVFFIADVDLQRDAKGVITGFTGTNSITHRDAVFQDNGNNNVCATYDVSYSIVGAKTP